MLILSIETSCDETSAAIVQGDGVNIRILSNVIGSQIEVHRSHGGVVPELAARAHAERVIDIIRRAFAEAFLHKENIDAVAATIGPGLMIALLTGVQTAQTIAYAFKKPLLAVNHLEGHLYSILGHHEYTANFFDEPAIALIVSGGHTELIRVDGYGKYTLLGRTRDDAAGEAFDKTAKLLGLPYPGGPALSKIAETGKRDAFAMPRAMMKIDDYNFSFSGIKTHVLYLLRDLRARGKDIEPLVPNIAASFEEAVTDVLVAKTILAADQSGVRRVVVTGGVSANKRLQEKMTKAAQEENIECCFPPPSLTGDNAGMIGIASYMKVLYTGKYDNPFKISAEPNLTLCPTKIP